MQLHFSFDKRTILLIIGSLGDTAVLIVTVDQMVMLGQHNCWLTDPTCTLVSCNDQLTKENSRSRPNFKFQNNTKLKISEQYQTSNFRTRPNLKFNWLLNSQLTAHMNKKFDEKNFTIKGTIQSNKNYSN